MVTFRMTGIVGCHPGFNEELESLYQLNKC